MSIQPSKILVMLLFGSVIPLGNLTAQSVDLWLYYEPGTGSAALWQTTHPTITNADYLEIGGASIDDDQWTRWKTLMESGYVYGGSSSLVRGWDMSEDWDVNWGTPAIEATAWSSRWVSIEGNYASTSWTWKATADVGPHPNELFRGNPDLLAVGDDHAVFWDSDNTFSYYYLGGTLTADYTWTSLNGGGLLDGQTLSESLMRTTFIGYEEGLLAFLTGDDRVDFYSLAAGTFVRFTDYSAVSAGPLAGDITLASIIDGLHPEYSYIGIDSLAPGVIIANVPPVVPEPSISMLLLGAGMYALIRRRR